MDKFLYDEMFKIEETHWWFVARREIVLDQLDQFLSNKGKILDIGCGTGVLIGFLEKFGEVYGLDSSPFAIEYCQQRGKGVIRKGALPEDIPFDAESFDLITALDVIEHIGDDVAALKVMHKHLRKGGIFICTVPAFSFLWSGHDEVHHHCRRYNRQELKEKLVAAGFGINKISYYNTLLFPLIALIRFIRKFTPAAEHKSDAKMPSRIANAFLRKLFASEKYMLRYLNLPYGISLLVIAVKK